MSPPAVAVSSWRVLVGEAPPAPDSLPTTATAPLTSLRGTSFLLLVLTLLDAVSRASIGGPGVLAALGYGAIGASGAGWLFGLVAGRARGVASDLFRSCTFLVVLIQLLSLLLTLRGASVRWALPALVTQTCAILVAFRGWRRARRPRPGPSAGGDR